MVHYYLLSIMLLNIENKRLHRAYILAGFAIQRERMEGLAVFFSAKSLLSALLRENLLIFPCSCLKHLFVNFHI